MSAEMIMTLSAFITLGIGMAAGFAWTVRRIDTSADSVRSDLGARIDKVDSRIDKVDDRLESLGRDMTELKVSVARLEGPRPHLLTAK